VYDVDRIVAALDCNLKTTSNAKRAKLAKKIGGSDALRASRPLRSTLFGPVSAGTVHKRIFFVYFVYFVLFVV
jgi:hypothetical protein